MNQIMHPRCTRHFCNVNHKIIRKQCKTTQPQQRRSQKTMIVNQALSAVSDLKPQAAAAIKIKHRQIPQTPDASNAGTLDHRTCFYPENH